MGHIYTLTKLNMTLYGRTYFRGCDIDNIELCARMTNLQVLSLRLIISNIIKLSFQKYSFNVSNCSKYIKLFDNIWKAISYAFLHIHRSFTVIIEIVKIQCTPSGIFCNLNIHIFCKISKKFAISNKKYNSSRLN